MPIILQLETSTDVCSVAISRDGILLSIAESQVSNSHSEVITLLIEGCLNESGISKDQIDAIAISDGPGSYTSLRVGTATAKGVCYGLDIPMLAIDSLQILAAGIYQSQIAFNDVIIPMIDARRMEVYTAVFDKKLEKTMDTHAHILHENSLEELTQASKVHICGSGAEKFIENFPSEKLMLHHTKTSAAYMCNLAMEKYQKSEFVDIAYYVPNYFKAPNITKSTKNLF
jgi:tRNA threonylcarbamoyladenosine biosynthesis protein TsaB